MNDYQKRLIHFAETTLFHMESESDWGPDFMEVLQQEARGNGLSDVDENGCFRALVKKSVRK